MALFIGLMSGTSLDGVDAVLVDLGERTAHALEPAPALTVRAHVHRPFAPALREQLLALNTRGASNELHRAALAANGVSAAYAEVVQECLTAAGVAANQVHAIGAHGQTVRHQPDPGNPLAAYTIQLLNGALLAELTGLDVVCDFRSRDVAAGGQGAPLVPAFHAAMFSAPTHRAVLNLGGIANLTLLPPTGSVSGFDCGPANGLLDGWCERHLGRSFDEGGQYAASAAPDAALLAHLMTEPYFAAPPPKSTGRDLFNMAWLDDKLAQTVPCSAAVVQSTLASLVAVSVAGDLMRHAGATTELFVCGGGAFNRDLMMRLGRALPGIRIDTTAALGLPPDQVEACAFAWLAQAYLRGHDGNLPSVTGAQGQRPLGAWYRQRNTELER